MSKTNPVVAITGASSGIGAALAVEAGTEGARVALMARRVDELEDIARQVRDRGGDAMVVPMDVSIHEDVLRAFQVVRDEWGIPDVVIANAGVGKPSSVRKMRMQEITQLFQVNYFGVLHAADAVLNPMIERGSGRFAAVSSLAGWRGLPLSGSYSASKAAVTAWMEASRVELQNTGVHLTTVHPGFVRTPMTAKNRFPMPFLMDADRASRIIYRGILSGQSEVNFPFGTAALMRVARHLPNPVYDRVIRGKGK